MESDNESIDSMSSFDDYYDRIRHLDDWNPLNRIEDYDTVTGRPWKIIQEEEFQKITSLSTEELFSYISHAVRSNWFEIELNHKAVYQYEFIFGMTGPDAANEYEKTLMSIVMKLKNRLEEEVQISGDIQNVREVMAGNISVSDHTALFCVHNRMRKTARASKIRRYEEKMTYFIKNIEAVFQMHHMVLQKQEERERLEARRSRKRRAPERLNITSTRKKSYH